MIASTEEEITRDVLACQRCDLCSQGTPVPPTFAENVDLVVVGGLPSDEESLYGRAFVSREGALLDRLLERGGYDPARVHKTLAVKCVPDGPPGRRSIVACAEWLWREIDAASPRAVLCLGGVAGPSLLTRPTPLSKIMGTGLFCLRVPVYFWSGIGTMLLGGRKSDHAFVSFLRSIRGDLA